MRSILTNLYDEKLKAYRMQQLLEKKSKSSEEITELNSLMEDQKFALEMISQPEYADMIAEFTNGFSCSEDIDFMIGTFYGMNAQGICKKDIDEAKKDKMLKLCAKMWFDIRNESIKKLKENMNSPMEQPKPYKP